MKSSKRRQSLERVYLEAVVMGLCIGLAALLINQWVGESSWPWRGVVLMIVGGVLCLVQYVLARARARR